MFDWLLKHSGPSSGHYTMNRTLLKIWKKINRNRIPILAESITNVNAEKMAFTMFTFDDPMDSRRAYPLHAQWVSDVPAHVSWLYPNVWCARLLVLVVSRWLVGKFRRKRPHGASAAYYWAAAVEHTGSRRYFPEWLFELNYY